MSGARRVVLGALALLALVPASAGAHAALLRTVPSASGTVDGSPSQVALTYSEAVEPRFALVSVTDASGNRVTTGPAVRNEGNATELDVPLRHLGRGWYLVYWRVISVDGHPVRGAFTFAVGPNQGPAPQFAIPSHALARAFDHLLVLGFFHATLDECFRGRLFVIRGNSLGHLRGGAGHRVPAFAHRHIVGRIVHRTALGQFTFRFLPIFRRRLVVCAAIDDCDFTRPLSYHFGSDRAQTARVFFHVAIGNLTPLFHAETYVVKRLAQLPVFKRSPVESLAQ